MVIFSIGASSNGLSIGVSFCVSSMWLFSVLSLCVSLCGSSMGFSSVGLIL